MMPAVGVSPSGDDTDTLPPSSDANSVVSNSSSGRGSEDGQASWPSLKARQRTTAGAAVVATSSSPSSISADRHDNSQLDQDRLDRSNPGAAGMMDPHLEPVDRVLLLVADGQELSRRVLGNERQCARLGDRLSALKNPLWQLQARVRTQAVRPPDFIDMLSEEVSHCLDVLLELTHPDWWNQICRKHDASVFRDLNERLVYAVRGDRQFEAALAFPRSADEDRADRIVDFEHLQGVLELHAGRLENRPVEREELWRAIAGLRLSEPADITGFMEINRKELTFGSGMPLGGFGTCVEATWHGSRVAVKQLLTATRFGSGEGGSSSSRSSSGGSPALVSPAAASAMRRQVRLLQALRFEFLVPILGACTAPPAGGSLVMPLSPLGSLHTFLHGGNAGTGADAAIIRGPGGVLRRGSLRRSNSSSSGFSNGTGSSGGGSGSSGNGPGGGGSGGGSDTGGLRKGQLSAGEKAAMAFDVARGMLHLHENGFIHGSLKCKNVMVHAYNRLVVSDYGLLPIKAIERETSAAVKQRAGSRQSGGSGGGPASPAGVAGASAAPEDWVAPEITEGHEHSNQSDMYSYGGVLYELLSEQLPPASAAVAATSTAASGGGRRQGAKDGARHQGSTLSPMNDRLRTEASARVLKMPAGVEAHPGQVQLMERCLRRAPEMRPGGFYVIVSFLHDLVKSLGGDERRKMPPSSPSPSSTSSKLDVGASTGTEIVAATDSGVGGARGKESRGGKEAWPSNEAFKTALDAQARLERQLAASQAKCAELEKSERKASAAAAASAAARLKAAEDVAAAAAIAFGDGGLGGDGGKAVARALRSPSVKGLDGDGVEGADGVTSKGRSATSGGSGVSAKDSSAGGNSSAGGGEGDEQTSRRRTSRRERARMGRVESHSTTGTETDSGFGGNGSFDSTGGVSVGVVRLSAEYGLDAAGGGRGEDSGARTTSGRLRREVLAMKLLEAQQKEKSMQEALEEIQKREKSMREELATGLAGAKGLQAELKEGKRREDELRATNAILVAKSTPPPRAAAAGKTTWSDGAAEGSGGSATPPSGQHARPPPSPAANSLDGNPSPSTAIATTGTGVAGDKRNDEGNRGGSGVGSSVTAAGVSKGGTKAVDGTPPPVTPVLTLTLSSSSSSSPLPPPVLAADGDFSTPLDAQRERGRDGSNNSNNSNSNYKKASPEAAEDPPSSAAAVAAVEQGSSTSRREIQEWQQRVSNVLSASDEVRASKGRGARKVTMQSHDGEQERSRDGSSTAAAGGDAGVNSDTGLSASSEGVFPRSFPDTGGSGSSIRGSDRKSRRRESSTSSISSRGRRDGRGRGGEEEEGSRDDRIGSGSGHSGSKGGGSSRGRSLSGIRKSSSSSLGGASVGSLAGDVSVASSSGSSRSSGVMKELKKERQLRRQFYHEKTEAEAEIAKLKEALRAHQTQATGAVVPGNGGEAEVETSRSSGQRRRRSSTGSSRTTSAEAGGRGKEEPPRWQAASSASTTAVPSSSIAGDGLGPSKGTAEDSAPAGAPLLGAPNATLVNGFARGGSWKGNYNTSSSRSLAAGIGGNATGYDDDDDDDRGPTELRTSSLRSSAAVRSSSSGRSSSGVFTYGGQGGGLGLMAAPVSSVGERDQPQHSQLIPPISKRTTEHSSERERERHQQRKQKQHGSGSTAAGTTAVATTAAADSEDGGDRAALATLFRRCEGLRWLRRAGWDGEVDGRYGVRWTADRLRVSKLELGTNRLEGSIPDEIAVLTRLLCLRLDHNQLLGSIPPAIGYLTMLQQLELQGNSLTDSIPKEIGGLVSLQYLGLHNNALSGEIPKELGKLTKLQHLALCNNRLVGNIPPELGALYALEQLYLNQNQLSGPIPHSVGRLTNLKKLRLECNLLSGTIPMELGNLSRLQYVNLGYSGLGNHLVGEIPIKAFANMPNLAWLSMTDNPGLAVKRGRFGASTQSLLKKSVPTKCDVFV